MPVTYPAHRVSVQGTCYGIQVVNVFNVIGFETPLESATAVGLAYGTAFKSRIASQYDFGEAHSIDMSALDGDTATFSMSQFESGDGGPAGEQAVALLARWTDDLTGRAYRRGRSFLGPVAAADMATGQLAMLPTARGQWQTAIDLFLSELANSFGTLAIAHGIKSGSPVLGAVFQGEAAVNTGHLDTRRT
jgi:hypothetical protein